MLHKKCAYFRMVDIGAYKASTIFVSQPFTVYEVDFFDSWYDFGWLQNRQSLCLDFFRSFKKWGAQPKFWLIWQWFLALKPFLAFFSKKRSPQMNWFLCISLIEFLSTFSHLNFFVVLNHLWLLNVLECWPFLRC